MIQEAFSQFGDLHEQISQMEPLGSQILIVVLQLVDEGEGILFHDIAQPL